MKDNLNIEMASLPDPSRLPSVEQLSEWLVDPAFREAVLVMEQASGSVSDLRLLVHRQLKPKIHDRNREYIQRRVIDLAERKATGKFL